MNISKKKHFRNAFLCVYRFIAVVLLWVEKLATQQEGSHGSDRYHNGQTNCTYHISFLFSLAVSIMLSFLAITVIFYSPPILV